MSGRRGLSTIYDEFGELHLGVISLAKDLSGKA